MATADGSAEHIETIDALLAENRTFPPSEDIKRDALVTGTFLYDEAAADDEGFWAKQAAELLDWDERLDDDPRLAAALRQVVRRRQAQRCVELPRPPRRCRQRRAGRHPLGRRAGRHPHDHLRRAARRGAALRQRPQGPRRGQGRPGQHLPADGSRGGDRHARLRPHRRAAQCRLRRVLGAGPRRPDQRRRRQGADHGRRRLSPRRGVPAQAGRRRGGRGDVDDRARRRRAAGRQRRRDGRGPRPLVPRARRRRRGRVPGRADGRRGPAVPAVHVGHDRQAEGHHAHHRRLPHAGRLHAQVRVRPPSGDRRVLVHRRRRLGHRAQLHRLRTAGQRQRRS